MDEKLRQQNEELLSSLATEKLRADELEQQLTEQRARADKAEAEAHAAKRRADEADVALAKAANIGQLETQIKVLTAQLQREKRRADEASDPKRIDALVRERTALVAKASAVVPDIDFTSMTDVEIKKSVIDRLDEAVSDDKSPDYVAALFDQLVKSWTEGRAALDRVNAALDQRGDSSANPAAPQLSAREKMIQRNQNAWRAK